MRCCSHRSATTLAEDARLITQLYGDRLDLGVTSSWSDSVPTTCRELTSLLTTDAPAMPYTEDPPALWLMVSRPEAASLAAELGLGLCASFHHGGTRASIRDLIARYRDEFRPGSLAAPHAIAMLSGVAAEDAAALESARASYQALVAQLAGTGSTKQTVAFDGLPETVSDLARTEGDATRADEVMLLFLETRGDAADRLAPVIARL